MQTSARGVAALEAEEGVVLKAYLCPANRWTIGPGLTAASGVVRPKAGMVITKAEATNLLQRALREKYEPSVEMAMSVPVGSKVSRPKQHEFDAGVSFHWNTGAIRKASWVKIWINLGKRRGPDADDVRQSLMQWTKGGGKVLPGLVARRQREAAMLLDGIYPHSTATPPAVSGPVHALARWSLPLTASERSQAFTAFKKLGYSLGKDPAFPSADGIRKFQADHDLTVDGIIGRATLSTLQRRIDAPKAAAKPAAAAVLPAATATDVGSTYADALGASGADWIAIGLIGFWGLATAWRYRDVIAAKIARPAPRLATFLRSF